jgi:phenylalanyl-tRNA synthetase beta chain
MRVPIAWLRDYLPAVPESGAALDAFCNGLTMAGLEVEEVLPDTPTGPTLFTKITPNRGDWASLYGTAREAAAVDPDLQLLPLPQPPTDRGDASALCSVTIEDPDNCHRFHALILRGVRVGATPEWMQERLSAALGERYRMINNVADITNYVMLETGQPLHAFDLATIPDGKIVVRQARPDESLVTLDGGEYALPEGTLCICDHEKPISIAGIMGGRATEITDSTVDILLETAHFDPYCIRRTAKKTLRSEASYRFERTVDPELVPTAGWRAARLITELCGGTIVGAVDTVARPTPRRVVLARMDRIRALLGADVDRDAAVAGLERLGISVERSAGALECLIPSWRPDLSIEDDIAEEVARIALGYANLPEKLSPPPGERGSDTPRMVFIDRVRAALVNAGLQEAVSHSLVAPESHLAGTDPDRIVRLRNPMAPEYSQLRTSLLPNLLAIASRANREGLRDLALFEVGTVSLWDDGAIVEPLRIAGTLAGSMVANLWSIRPDALPADFASTRGVVDELLRALGLVAAYTPSVEPIAHPYRTAQLTIDGERVGWIGELSEATAEARETPRRTVVFDLDGDALSRLAGSARMGYAPLPRFPAVTRDLAPVFEKTVPFARIDAAARSAAGPSLESLRLTDVYDGANVGEGHRSLTLRFVFRSATATLTDGEVEEALRAVRAALTALGGVLRG